MTSLSFSQMFKSHPRNAPQPVPFPVVAAFFLLYADGMRAALHQFTAFFLVGVISAVAHYGTLIGLVEAAQAPVVASTLVGYVAGGLVSYFLNRALTFKTGRPHDEAGWRFIVVAGVGFGLTYVFMSVFVEALLWPYVLAQLVTTGVVMFWSFAAHKFWTFRFVPPV